MRLRVDVSKYILNTRVDVDETHLVLHRELALALRCPTKRIRVSEHIVQSDLGGDGELILTDLAVDDGAAARGDAANDGTLEFDGCDDLNGHDRFEDDRRRLAVDFTDGPDDGETEGKFGRIYDVRETVGQHKADARDGSARQGTLLDGFVKALSTA